MAARVARNASISRAEQVRRRRQQKSKRRYDAVSRVAGTTTLRSGPLVSRPRTGPAISRLASVRRGGVLAALLPAGFNVRLPALPRGNPGWRPISATLLILRSRMLGGLLSHPRQYIH